MSLIETLKLTFIRVVGEISTTAAQIAQDVGVELSITKVDLFAEESRALFVLEGKNWVNHQVREQCELRYVPEIDICRFCLYVEGDSMASRTILNGQLVFDHLVGQNADDAARSILAYAYGRKLPEQS